MVQARRAHTGERVMIGRLLCWLGFHKWTGFEWSEDGKGNSGIVSICQRPHCRAIETL